MCHGEEQMFSQLEETENAESQHLIPNVKTFCNIYFMKVLFTLYFHIQPEKCQINFIIISKFYQSSVFVFL